MKKEEVSAILESLKETLEGEIFTDTAQRILYATDASAYREIPFGVARPKNPEDIRHLIRFAHQTGIPLIPRAAGTSLAGQVVGSGLVVDVSRHMTRIIEINPEGRYAIVEPGVILDELNREAEKHGLFFGPETSTSSRCMIGGMVGNNSCGAHSILYGSTRDHVLSVTGLLSDGSQVEFSSLNEDAFHHKCKGDSLESKIYRQLKEILGDPANREAIRREYPDPAIHRRNTGYALDLLLETEPFASPDAPGDAIHPPINLSALIAGSEGTLMFITRIRLNLVPLPPKHKALMCVHCRTLDESLRANLVALRHQPGSVELMDKAIMDCTLDNITQRQNRFFISGDPAAILIIEFARDSKEEIEQICLALEKDLRTENLGYHYPVVYPPMIKRVWELRKAGLGVLSNYPGDRKPVPVIEDTAVRPEDLPMYIAEFNGMLDKLGLDCVYYAHVGSGELHLRPVLNLKDPADVELFHTVALETARLVKKYRGSLSGEHGDGRLRGEFIPLMLGERIYELFREIKDLWDPDRIFNPNKITDTPKMNTSLRYEPGAADRHFPTHFDFTRHHGILRAAEQCNGSGDCRNTELTGRGMCPSYMAVREENTTTRARANVLREFLTRSDQTNPFNHREIYEAMDLCLSCKACKSECPSNVDMARLKAEFLQHWYDANGVPLRSSLIAYITRINKLGSMAPRLFNFFLKNTVTAGLAKSLLGFAPGRAIPLLWSTTLRAWAGRHAQIPCRPAGDTTKEEPFVYLFVDEFSQYNDVEIGIKTIKLLNALGYRVILPDHAESGRTWLSKGLVRQAKKLARENVSLLSGLVSEEHPLLGIEPSAILTFRDEYPDLVDPPMKAAAERLAAHSLMVDEFIARLADSPVRGSVVQALFSTEAKEILLHGHCHQKALASVESTKKILSLPPGYTVTEIPSGCCGMAGSFGYEKEHFDVSMKVGELVLFPAVRKAAGETVIVAPGTSCRHQIREGTGRKAFHPVEVLFDALKTTE